MLIQTSKARRSQPLGSSNGAEPREFSHPSTDPVDSVTLSEGQPTLMQQVVPEAMGVMGGALLLGIGMHGGAVVGSALSGNVANFMAATSAGGSNLIQTAWNSLGPVGKVASVLTGGAGAVMGYTWARNSGRKLMAHPSNGVTVQPSQG